MSFVDKLRQFERKAAANQSTTSNRIEPIAIVTLRDPLQVRHLVRHVEA